MEIINYKKNESLISFIVKIIDKKRDIVILETFINGIFHSFLSICTEYRPKVEKGIYIINIYFDSTDLEVEKIGDLWQ